MLVELLKHTIKAPTEYSYAYVLITGGVSLAEIRDIRRKGKKVVFFGSTPESYLYWRILQDNGIEPDYACDVYCEYSYSNHGVAMRPYWELLAEKDKYYFIITVPQRHNVRHVVKQLLYAGIDDFGIVFSEWSKDFAGKHQAELQKAFFEALNEVYAPLPLLGDYSHIENLRRTALEGAGYWDVLYMSIHRLALPRKHIDYLEVGPGTGIMSFSLKIMLGQKVAIDWLDVPVEKPEDFWQENSGAYFKSLLEKYDVHQYLAYVELDQPLPVANKKYDCIVLAQVMEHLIFNPVSTFWKLSNLLTDHGMIYVAVPHDHKFFNVRSWKEMPEAKDLSEEQRRRRIAINEYGHFHEYTYEQAVEVFEAAGLEVVYYRWNDPIHFFMLCKARGAETAHE